MYRTTLLMAVLAFLASTATASAQQVRWRTDYNVAWNEACASGKPLFVAVGSASCTWCKRFEETTCRDLEVVRQLNDQFIPVKLDGDQNSKFVAALRLRAYPALVFGTGDGRLLDLSEGYVDVAAFRGKIAAALAQLPPVHAKSDKSAVRTDSEVMTAMTINVGILVGQRLTSERMSDMARAWKANDPQAIRKTIVKMFDPGVATGQTTITLGD
jgi:thioredoxin-related protein